MGFEVLSSRDLDKGTVCLRITFAPPVGAIPRASYSVVFGSSGDMCLLPLEEGEEVPISLKFPEKLAKELREAFRDLYDIFDAQ